MAERLGDSKEPIDVLPGGELVRSWFWMLFSATALALAPFVLVWLDTPAFLAGLLRAVIARFGYLVPILPIAAIWFYVVVWMHLRLLRTIRDHLSRRRDGELGFRYHVEKAREVLEEHGRTLADQLPPEVTIQTVLVEGCPPSGRGRFPAIGMVFLAAGVGATSLGLIVSIDGWGGLFVSQLALILALVSLAIERRPLHWSVLGAVGITMLVWFRLPAVSTGESLTVGFFDILIVLPGCLICVNYLKHWHDEGWRSFLVVADGRLFYGRAGRDGVRGYVLDESAAVTVTEDDECYTLGLVSTKGHTVPFHVATFAELTHLGELGPLSCRGLSRRVRSRQLFHGFEWSFLLAALALAATTILVALFALSAADAAGSIAAWERGNPKALRRAAAVMPWLFPWSASGHLAFALNAVDEERFSVARRALNRSKWWSGGAGRAGNLVRYYELSGMKRFCELAPGVKEKAAEVQGPEGVSPAAFQDYETARRYAMLVEDLASFEPPGSVVYPMLIWRLRRAHDAAPQFAEASFLLVQAMSRQAVRHHLPMGYSRETLDDLDSQAEELLAALKGNIDERRLNEVRGRILFRREEFSKAVDLLKTMGGHENALLVASAARFIDTPVAWHLRRIRKIGAESVKLNFEVKLLEALLLARLGKHRQASKLLLLFYGDAARGYLGKHRQASKSLASFYSNDARGYMARFLNILVRHQGNLPTPYTSALERKVQKRFNHPSRFVDDLPWPEWMAKADLDYLAALRQPVDQERLARLGRLTWYPAAARVRRLLVELQSK